MTLDFWFDYSSPYAYLASTQVAALAARTHATLRWRPMLLGAVFKQVGQVDVPMLAAGEAKQRYYALDMARWADVYAIPFRFPDAFPIRSVLPLRVTLATPDPQALIQNIFRAAWGEGLDITDPDVLRRCGASERALAAAPEMKQALFDATAAAVTAGVFGAPTCVVDERWLFWGQDRLELVERCLKGWVPPG